MTRSRRKTPISAWSLADSDKPYKTAEHKRERRTVHQRLKVADDTDAAIHQGFGDPAQAPKDGKQYFGSGASWMRK